MGIGRYYTWVVERTGSVASPKVTERRSDLGCWRTQSMALPKVTGRRSDLSCWKDSVHGATKSDREIPTWVVGRIRSMEPPKVTERGSDLDCWKDSIRGVSNGDAERFQLGLLKGLNSWRHQEWQRKVPTCNVERSRFVVSPIVTQRVSDLNRWKNSIRGVTKGVRERFRVEMYKELDSRCLQWWRREVPTWNVERTWFAVSPIMAGHTRPSFSSLYLPEPRASARMYNNLSNDYLSFTTFLLILWRAPNHNIKPPPFTSRRNQKA